MPLSSSFDVEKFNQDAIHEEHIDPEPVLDYINSFENVILYGAANFGEKIGAYLLKNKVSITAYWDARADDIGRLNEAVVTHPFTGNWNKADTLIILCVNNNVLKAPLWNQIMDMGFHGLKGEYLFMGLMCPFTKHTGVRAKTCIDTLTCRFICCERLTDIVAHQAQPKGGEPIHLTYVCVLVNSVCNLDCKGCVQYINNYPKHLQTNVETSRVIKDIKKWLGTVDSIGGVSIMGGETFLHPDIHWIAEALSECDNFGLASFPTNGAVSISERKLEGFRDPRLSINFGNYLEVLSERQRDIFHANVERVRSMGISHTVGNPMREWIKPSTMYNRGMTPTQMTEMKSGCPMPPRNLQAKDGKIFPCDLGAATCSMGIIKDDYLDIDTMTRDNLRAFINRPYHLVCGHCDGYHETCEAMEQGFTSYMEKR